MSLLLAVISSPTGDTLALFLVQVMIIITLVRLLGRALVKIRMPMVIGEIVAGILLGPSAFGAIPHFSTTIFPTASLVSLKLFADIGLIFFMFFLGLEVDIDAMRKSLRQSIPIAVCSIVVPFGCGSCLSIWFYNLETTTSSFTTFLLFFGTALSFTAFPVLARVLTSANLLASPVGGQAIGCAAVDDLLAWCTLALTLSYAAGGGPLNGLYVALISILLVIFLLKAVRPGLAWYHQRLIERDDELNRNFLALLFLLLCLTAWFSEILGIEAFVGSFIFGIVVPRSGTLIEYLAPKIELLIVEFFLPLYFANSGLRTNIGGLDSIKYWGAFLVVVLVGSVAKIMPVMLIARATVRLNKYGELFSPREAADEISGGDDLVPALHTVEPLDEGKPMPWKQCLTLGVLMNTRGLVGLIVLNIGLSAGILGEKVFTLMVLFSLVTTFATPPLLYTLYQKPYHALRAEQLAEAERLEAAALAKELETDAMLDDDVNEAQDRVDDDLAPKKKLGGSGHSFNHTAATPSPSLSEDDNHIHPALYASGATSGSTSSTNMGPQSHPALAMTDSTSSVGVNPLNNLDRNEAALLATQLAAFSNTNHAAIEAARRDRSDTKGGLRKLGSRQSSHEAAAARAASQSQGHFAINVDSQYQPPARSVSRIADYLFGPTHDRGEEYEMMEVDSRSLSTRHAITAAQRRDAAERDFLDHHLHSANSFSLSRRGYGHTVDDASNLPRRTHLTGGNDDNINHTGPAGFGRAGRAATTFANGATRRHSHSFQMGSASPPQQQQQLSRTLPPAAAPIHQPTASFSELQAPTAPSTPEVELAAASPEKPALHEA